ncbi:MAG: hypothetical protein HC895_00865 [Leptolyngbyaceae cyanobacterium SM1_3_5]|nr:hypothetical protein [Leptolyngbyaceae cyanobacterium SM1_3_5]
MYQVNVSFSDGTKPLWYSVSSQFRDLISDRADAPLVALLIPAMARGEAIHVEGVISEKLYYNLSGLYQRILQSIIPSLHLIDIYPSEVQSSSQKALGVATGFSAGIDSFSALADHHYNKDVPAGFQLTHLLYNNVGSHAGGGEILFKKRYEALKPLVDERIGLPFVAVNSNVQSFYKGFSFQQTHTPRNASVALLLQNGIGRYLYASAYTYTDTFIGKTDSNAYSDLITLPLLSTESLEAFSVGSEYTRVQKTLQVAEIEDSYQALDVCVRGDHESGNCSVCWKCMRTQLTLDIAGILDRYTNVFDLEAYQRQRSAYIVRTLQDKNVFSQEIISFAAVREFEFPPVLKLQADFPPLQYFVKKISRY